MTVCVANAQREVRVNLSQMRRLAQSALRRLKIRGSGQFSVTFIDSATMQALNRQFKKHDRPTDVLSFRYDGEPVVGDVLIAPKQAQAYAREHGIAYTQELSRYVVHGILHWQGHEDRTTAEQRAMRAREDNLLSLCGILVK